MTDELSKPPCINGFFIPQYYRIKTPQHDFICGAAPRSGSTSLYFMAKHLRESQSLQVKEVDEAVCIIRHPIRRIASAWLLLPEEVAKERDDKGDVIRRWIQIAPIEETIDAILDDTAGEFFTAKIGNSAHAYAWQRQSELYSGCKNPKYIRLEGIESIYGLELPHYNVAEREKPEITHRLDELLEYYAEDLKLWESAPTKL